MQHNQVRMDVLKQNSWIKKNTLHSAICGQVYVKLSGCSAVPMAQKSYKDNAAQDNDGIRTTANTDPFPQVPTLTLEVSVFVWLTMILKIQLLDHHLLRLQQIPRKILQDINFLHKNNLFIQISVLKVMHLRVAYFCTSTNILALPSQLKTLWKTDTLAIRKKKQTTHPHPISKLSRCYNVWDKHQKLLVTYEKSLPEKETFLK